MTLDQTHAALEHMVWPIDRAFFLEHPERKYRIRLAEPVELCGYGEPPRGEQYYVLVQVLPSGACARYLFGARDIGDRVYALDENFCRRQFHTLDDPDTYYIGTSCRELVMA